MSIFIILLVILSCTECCIIGYIIGYNIGMSKYTMCLPKVNKECPPKEVKKESIYW